jgi:hypothetical protein
MATNTAGSIARNDYNQDIKYLAKRFTSVADATTATFTLGVLPAGATIIAPISGVDVLTVSNAGTNNRLNIGITGTTAKYAANSSLLTAGFVPMAVAVGHRVTVDTPIIVTLDITGTTPTTGDFDVFVAYILYNDFVRQ